MSFARTVGILAAVASIAAGGASAARADIPDNQVFLTFRDPAAGYSIKYPEGWQRRGNGSDVTFENRNNFIHIVISHGAPFTLATVRADLAQLKASNPSARPGTPTAVKAGANSAFKVVYTMTSKPNPVTNKRVTVSVDRYYLSHASKRAIVDLAGVIHDDNVDAYRLIIQSFRWV